MNADLRRKQKAGHTSVKLSNLSRWSGPASILGVMLLVVHIALSSALGPAQGTSNPYEIYSPLLYVIYNLLFDAALLLFVLALAGAYVHQSGRLGRLGKIAWFLTLVAGMSLIVSAMAAPIIVLRPGLSVPLVFFGQLLTALCLILSLVILGIAALRAAGLHTWISSLHWRWMLLILAAGVGAALISDALQIVMSREILNMPGTHLLHVLVTIPVAIWVARKVATAPIMYGALVGLISGIINQIYFHVIMDTGTLRFYEVLVILPLSVAAGWLGGVVARSTLAEQETLYRASHAIVEASSVQDIVETIGERLGDPQVSHIALWQDVSETDNGGPMEFSLLAVWMPWVARVWGVGIWRPGLRLDATHVSTLTELRKQPLLVLRVKKLPASERAIWEHQGIRSAVLLPLVASSGARIGLLMVASRNISVFSRMKLRTFLTLSTQVALVLENLRLVEQAQQTGVSQERQRLAHEIHDTLAQGFTSIVMNLEAAEGMLHSDMEGAHQYLDQARSIARESLTEARRLMWALQPESLDRSSLAEALARLAEKWEQECGVAANTTITGTPHSLTPEAEVTLLRVTQEALNNCRKYAQASRVLITLSYMHNLVMLNIEDDGVGFDAERLNTARPGAHSEGGFGLMAMRERVGQLRGTLLVESAPGEGSTVMAAIPVATDKRAPGNTEAISAPPPMI